MMHRDVGTRSLSAFGLAAIMATAGIVGYHYTATQSAGTTVHSCGVIHAGPQVGQGYYLDQAGFDTLIDCFVELHSGQAVIEVDALGVDTSSTTIFESDGGTVRVDQRFAGNYGPPTHASARCRSVGIVPAGAVVFDCEAVQMTFMVNPITLQARVV